MDNNESQPLIQNKLPGMPGFIQTLAGYYCQFLETDFKKAREPKRKFLNQDRSGRRVGIRVSKYPGFRKRLIDEINLKEQNPTAVITSGKYRSDLSASIEAAIIAAIDTVDLDSLANDFLPLKQNIYTQLTIPNFDIEVVMSNTLDQMMNVIDTHVVSPVLDVVAPVFERQSSGSIAIEQLITYSEEISSILIKDAESQLPTAISDLAFRKDEDSFSTLMDQLQDGNRLKEILKDYFSDFATSDVFTELRELITTFKTTQNTQFYLNFGEVRINKSRLPLYFIPLGIKIDKNKIHIEFEPHLYTNKKAVEFIVGEISKSQQGISTTNPITERIFYKGDRESYVEIANETFPNILMSLQVDGEIDLSVSGMMSGNGAAGIAVNNEISISLSDKSDESIVNDYEALMLGLDSESNLLTSFTDLIENFLTQNPLSIEDSIDTEWRETKITDRLVFQSPLPLAEEQRKILSAIRHKDSKFISVEGPPGTGKSHTIAAIAFEMILKGKNILILSDKKEALDVVEGKLNDVIKKVRGEQTDYINPILRLGKTDSNYSNIVRPSSINKLKASLQAFKNTEKEFNQEFKNSEDGLKDDIENTISSVTDIEMDAIFDFYRKEDKFLENYPAIEEFYNDTIDVETLTSMVDIVENNRQGFSNIFSSDSSIDRIKKVVDLYVVVNLIPNNIRLLLTEFPELNLNESKKLDQLACSIQDIKNPLFGYLFSKAALTNISEQIYKITGVLFPKPQNVINKLKNLSTIDTVLSDILIQYGRDLSDKELLCQCVLFNFKITEKDKKVIDKYLKLDDDYLNEIGVPHSIQDLLSLKTKSSNILGICKDLNDTKKIIGDMFSKIPKFDYHASKTNIETLNAQRLTNKIDERVVKFATNKKADAKTLKQIIRNKSKFPTDKFDVLKNAFPCMIAGLRDYAEFIPFESDLFDLIIIDEASQVSISQALPAILRSKKMVVMGDRKQFSNVKTANASKSLNQGYFSEVSNDFKQTIARGDEFLMTKCNIFDIKNSVMEFFEMVSNFNIQLRKHFRSYPEMISFSSKYFYDDYLQVLKIRGKSIEDVFEFIEVEDLDRIETTRNASKQEAETIINRLIELIEEDTPPSVAIITPFTAQQKFISTMISEHKQSEDIQKKLKIAIFTFDSCQGEERDVIFYSMVANRQNDGLNYIFPKILDLNTSEDEIDGKLRFQRLNVGFSRGKEKLVFVLSKPIEEFSGSIGHALRHYKSQLELANKPPDPTEVDPSSPMELKLLEWIQQTSFYSARSKFIEIIPQFEIGKYLKSLDSSYVHPMYKVDFLLRIKTKSEVFQVILEYDGFEHHFIDQDQVNAMNWKSYLTPEDVERECILEGYGYKMLRINRFNLGNDPVSTLDDRLMDLLMELYGDFKSETIKDIQRQTKKNIQGLKDGTHKECGKCKQIKPKEDFYDSSLKTKYGNHCKSCKSSSSSSRSSYRGYRSRRRRYY